MEVPSLLCLTECNHKLAIKCNYDTQITPRVLQFVDVFVTLECIHLYILCLVPQCLFWEVSIMYLSHVN